MNYVVKSLMVFIAYFCSSEAFKILVISPLPVRSHYILSQSIVRHLTKAGHEITLVTAFPRENSSALYRTIHLSDLDGNTKNARLTLNIFLNQKAMTVNTSFILNYMRNISTITLENKFMQKIMNDPREKFDLIIAEWMFNDLYAGLAAVFQCPFIWLSTVEPHWSILHLIDEFPNPTYTPDQLSDHIPPLSFTERIHELGIQLIDMRRLNRRITRSTYIVPSVRKRGKPVPTFDELRYNVSLVLGNSHVSMGQALRLPQSYKSIRGYHIEKEVKPLPSDLLTLMDNAKDGVIYFSMGSNLKSSVMPDKMKKDILEMFERLKITTIWKFEEDLPKQYNQPSNVHTMEWAPQQSILSHPNCMLFITHGGILSTTEAVHYAVPIIGIPIYGDQFNNVARAVRKGFAKFVRFSHNMTADLEKAIHEIIRNPTYTAKVKELSFIYHHRPISPGDELVHWVEHVIYTKGALHLRSPALLVPWYQKIYLDLVCVVFAITVMLYVCIRRLSIKLISNKHDAKDKRQ